MNSLVDGTATECVPSDDRGLLFGESVFETVAFLTGRAPLWERHLARLASGARALGLEMPDRVVLERECDRLLQSRPADRAVIRITLTGGSGGHGYWPASAPKPRRILQRRAWPGAIERQRREGLGAVVSQYRLGPAGPLAGLKHGNRLLQTLIARECVRRGAEEALVIDERHRLAEALSSNLLLVADSRLMTPARTEVVGVGLSWLSETLGEELEVDSVGIDRLETLSEVLVINSVAGIRPLVAIERHRFPVGPVCRRLQSLWQKELFPCV